MLFKKHFHTIVIIGNGFDLAHNFNTDYKSFVQNTKSDDLDTFKEICSKDFEVETWYNFEENIRIIYQKLLEKSYIEDYNENRLEVAKIQKIFKNIHYQLINYLNIETNKPLIKNRNISKAITHSAFAINFNYTNTAEYYTDSIYYIHGSLAENDIILGYDALNEACLAQFEDIYWSKFICREMLAFRRFLRKDDLCSNDEKAKELIDSLEKYLHHENTGRGIDEEVKSRIPNYDFINSFLINQRTQPLIKDIDFNKIKKIIIIGHGIEADKVFLKDMLKKCKKLKKVIIFKYEKETKESINRKINFFVQYCKKITIKTY